MKHVRRYYLPVTVFLTGGCILVLEVVATRMLAPFFGNTIYTVSSVLSIVLAALSAGYYLGGKLADKQPKNQLFFGIIFAAGLGVLLIQTAHAVVLPALGRHLSLTTGPLVAGVLLFFAPNFALGTLSPFAIKLADMQRKKQGIGTIAGEMFFFSTVGSIVGSLLTGYVLIPHFGVSTIVAGTGLVLIVLGLLPLVYLWHGNRRLIALALIVALGLASVSLTPRREQAVVYNSNGLYQQLTIVDGVQKGRPVRFLFEDNSLAGGMYLDSDTDIFSDYQKYYVLSEAVQQRPPAHVAVIGGGMYIAPRALLQTYPQVRVDAVEIEPSLPGLSEAYFRLPKSPRLTHYITDGRRFLYDTPTKYDLIFSDVYLSLYSTPMHITTKEFFKTAYGALESDGLFIANIIDGMDNHKESVLRAEVRTLQQVFPNVYVFTTRGLDKKGLQNFIVVGHKSSQPLSFGSAQFAESQYPIIRALAKNQAPLQRLGLAGYPVLTDNYAPIENWAAAMARAEYD